MKQFLVLLFFIFFFVFTPTYCFAESTYTLPYPSVMPGNFFYKLRIILETAEQFWYFGNFSKFDYNLKQSDKYLVEAKTLFDYKQYILAIDALHKSDKYFSNTLPSLLAAKNEGKIIDKKYVEFLSALEKHREVLTELKGRLPQTFIWRAEKSSPNLLNIHNEIDQAINVRKI